jgi:hypothetical protein
MPPTNVDDTNEICLTRLTSACNNGTACFVDVVDTRTVYLASVVFTSEATLNIHSGLAQCPYVPLKEKSDKVGCKSTVYTIASVQYLKKNVNKIFVKNFWENVQDLHKICLPKN